MAVLNAYLREVTGGDDTAKDFRTWSATVMAAVGLAVSTHSRRGPTARRRAVTRGVVKEVAEKLGNAPAVCRASYIDPRIIDLYDNGVTIGRRSSRRWAARDDERSAAAQWSEAVVRLLRSL